jgi:hypothetical protein
MKRKICLFFVAGLLGLTASADNVYQLPNGDFEQGWHTESWTKFFSTYTSTIPEGFHSFADGTGSLISTAKGSDGQVSKVSGSRTGGTGSFYVEIYAKTVVAVVAQGNLTTGQINAASLEAGNSEGNYNFSNPTNTGYNQPFNGKPDAIKIWINFTPKTSTDVGKVSAIIHGNSYYQDPEANYTKMASGATSFTNVVAKTVNSISKTSAWTEFTYQFDYDTYKTYKAEPAYILLSFATNYTAGGGSSGDKMDIDDIKMVYYSQLATLTYDGTAVTSFSEDGNTNTTAYNVNSTYDETKLAYTLKGTAQAATVKESYDETTGLLTITVNGNDISATPTNYHKYYVQFIPTLALNETATYDGASTTTGTKHVTLTRKMTTGKWNTLCIPFGLTADQVAYVFGTGAKVAHYSSCSGTSMGFTTTDQTIKANEPCLVMPGSSYTGNAEGDIAVTSGSAGSIKFGDYTLQGSYTPGYLNVGDFFIKNGGFYYTDKANSVTMNAFRAYVTSSASGVKSLGVTVDGEATAVAGITVDEGNNKADIYNLNGQQVRQNGTTEGLPKGIYLIQGKKIAVK